MMAKHKPILGVCHGCFLLTEVLGGSITEVADHRDVDHTIDYFGETFTVNSFHSLAIGRVQKTATILATDGQGHCESWIDNNIAGVVWHPERMTQPFLPVEISNLLGI